MARAPEVRVLVCDLDMPRASGVEVVESLRGLSSPPAVVVVSGYMDPAVELRLTALPFVREVLRKPFDLLVFARRVAELAGPPGAAASEV
jgi:CheY-like chemotaxis protein